MYFTQFPINMTRRESRKMLSSPYMLHAAVAGSFPSRDPHSSQTVGRVLWRVDVMDDGPQWGTRDYDAFLARIVAGQTYAFRLVANPTVSRSTRAGNTDIATDQGASKRIGHLTVMQQAAWLVGKRAYAGTDVEAPQLFADQREPRDLRNGFEVASDGGGAPRLIVSHSEKITFSKGRQGKRITMARAQYDGVLRVTDADRFRYALVNGIGHEKAFGCGLLTIVPVGE